MTSILIANTPSKKLILTTREAESDRRVKSLIGYHSENDIKLQDHNVITAIFASILTHETIYIKPITVGYLLDTIGFSDTLKLFENKILKVCFGLDEFSLRLDDKILSLDFMRTPISKMEGFEQKITKSKIIKPSEFNKLLQFIDNSSIESNTEISKIIRSELITDITLPAFGFNSESIENINPVDRYHLLRVSDVAQGLVLQNKLGINSIYQDGFSKKYINTKLGAYSSILGNDSIQTFSNIMNSKGLPDIYKLYSKGVVTLDHILECRNTYNGGIFRKWFASEDYDESKVIRALINKPNKDKHSTKFIRFLYPTIAGLINPALGFGAALADSFLVGRILDGWSPSLFLDNVLKSNIDNKVKVFERKVQRDQFIKRFGSIGWNDPCPCQSGKKYKKCHGAK